MQYVQSFNTQQPTCTRSKYGKSDEQTLARIKYANALTSVKDRKSRQNLMESRQLCSMGLFEG